MQIKHKKAITDAKRGKIFSKLSRAISLAARDGADPAMNPRLREAIDAAKRINMPGGNIERAIARGSGKAEGITLESVVYEALGPAGAALIIEGITDSTNRTTAEIKHLLSEHGGQFAGQGSARWMFDQKAATSIEGKLNDDEQMQIIEAGADDIKEQDDVAYIYGSPEKLHALKQIAEKLGKKITNSSIEFVPKQSLEIGEKEKTKLTALLEALDDHPDVQEIYTNVKF